METRSRLFQHLRLLVPVAIVALLGWATRFGTRWPSVYVMTGPSMEPAVGAGEYFLAWDPPGAITRGDLVIFRFEDEDGVFHVLRRVAALPGDTLSMVAGAVVVNGAPQPAAFQILKREAWRSPVARGGNLYDWGPWIVPPDSVALLADTRDMIGWPDTRFIGFVPRSDVLARATRTLRGRRLR
jgi:signal peptidase I